MRIKGTLKPGTSNRLGFYIEVDLHIDFDEGELEKLSKKVRR